MTNFQMLKHMDIKQVAKWSVKYINNEGVEPYYLTSGGDKFKKEEWKKSIENEIEWLSARTGYTLEQMEEIWKVENKNNGN